MVHSQGEPITKLYLLGSCKVSTDCIPQEAFVCAWVRGPGDVQSIVVRACCCPTCLDYFTLSALVGVFSPIARRINNLQRRGTAQGQGGGGG